MQTSPYKPVLWDWVKLKFHFLIQSSKGDVPYLYSACKSTHIKIHPCCISLDSRACMNLAFFLKWLSSSSTGLGLWPFLAPINKCFYYVAKHTFSHTFLFSYFSSYWFFLLLRVWLLVLSSLISPYKFLLYLRWHAQHNARKSLTTIIIHTSENQSCLCSQLYFTTKITIL